MWSPLNTIITLLLLLLDCGDWFACELVERSRHHKHFFYAVCYIPATAAPSYRVLPGYSVGCIQSVFHGSILLSCECALRNLCADNLPSICSTRSRHDFSLAFPTVRRHFLVPMGRLDSQCGGHPAARQRITFRLGFLFFVVSLAFFLFVSMLSSNYSISTGYGATISSSAEKNGDWGQQLVNTNAEAGEILAADANLDASTGFDDSMSVAGCAENRAQRFDCLMDGHLYSYSEGGPWAAQMKQAQENPTQAHGSNLLILPSGELLCTWFSGVEGEDEVAIVLAHLPSGSVQWSDPIVVSVTKGRAAQNPVLFYDAESDVLVLYHTSQIAFRGQGTAHVLELRSSDKGQTWNNPRIVFRGPGPFVRNHLVLLPSGHWLMPMYYTPDGYGHFETHYSASKLSLDHGRTWKEYVMTDKGQFLVQPTVVQGTRGLIAFFRNRHADWMFTSVSTDEGRSWSKPPVKTVIPNNNSGLQALILRSGSLILVFNNRRGAKRYPLSIALSEDEGLTWKYVRDVEPGDPSELPPDGEYSYPSVAQSVDGFIHVSYTYLRQTIKYVRLNESWIRQGGTVGEFVSMFR